MRNEPVETDPEREIDPDDRAAALVLAQRLRLSIERLRRTVRNRRTLDGVSRPWESAISLLDRKGPLSTADLARWEQVRPQSMAPVVAGLIDAGLASKSPDPGDGRRELIALTPAGRTLLGSIAEQRDRDLADLVARQLTAEERRVIAQAFTLLERLGGAE
jgi:DNA-binding MarR family transcriptional regulator